MASLLYFINQQPVRGEIRFGRPADKWLYQSKAVKPLQTGPEPTSQLLLYILKLKKEASGLKLYVECVKTRIVNGGHYGETTPFYGDPESRARFIRDEDRLTLLLLKSLQEGYSKSSFMLTGLQGSRVLNELVDTGRCHWNDQISPPLKHSEEKLTTLSWQFRSDASQIARPIGLEKDLVVLPLVPPYYVNTHSGECGVLDCHIPAELAARMLSSPAVAHDEVDKVRSLLSAGSNEDGLPLPEKPRIVNVNTSTPRCCLKLLNDRNDFGTLDEDDEQVGIAHLYFDYDGYYVHPLSEKNEFIREAGDGFEIIQRDTQFEKQALEQLDEIGLIGDDMEIDTGTVLVLEPVHRRETWVDFMLHHRQSLEDDGWIIEISNDFSFQIDEAENWYAEIDEQSNDWFKIELGIDFDGQHINVLPFLVNYLNTFQKKEAALKLHQLPDDYPLLLRQDNDHLLHIPLYKVRHIIETLVELYDADTLGHDGKLKFSRYQSSQLSTLENEHVHLHWSGGDQLRKFGDQLRNFKGIQTVTPPDTLKANLRDYQKEGLNWLQFLREFDLGGILADDMGLGKTVQALAHLLVEKTEGRADCPSLVVAPTSLMVNWQRESARFAPDLSVLVLQGVDRKQKFDSISEYDLVLTTYPLLSRDRDVLLQQQWHVVILDEAQHIKNPLSRAAQTARLLNSHQRLCLTGTPMENHLGELWSQFHFLMPGLLGDEKSFRKLFRVPIERHADIERQQRLLDRITPFLLRRDKSQVATELPAKIEIVSEVELQGAQRDLYEAIRVSMHDRLRQVIDDRGIAKSQIMILDALLKLRQVCCHPQLLKMQSAKKVKRSAKLDQLMEMLPEMVEEGRRILLFSQFTSMLSLIEDELIKHNIGYVKLTGQTTNREKPVDDFQSEKVPVFLISLKAGGSGLNLTAADTVIHYDPWWNPAAENQATDRAHRIGQDKPVFVYKLITENTVEEKILSLQEKKLALINGVYKKDQEKLESKLTAEDLDVLFSPLHEI